MKRNKWLARLVLLPASKVYGVVTYVRNKLFDFGILKQREFDVPVIVVGNIAVGGTGKTPHVEYIVEILRHSYHIGVVSRGYKRKTKGFVVASKRSTPLDIGDEPYQIYHKFDGNVSVAVCEDRVTGINELLKVDPDINLIVLDDAFQHRYVKPTIAVLLTEYNRPLKDDSLMPYGRLRESKAALKRASVVVISKCPGNIKPIEYRTYQEDLNLLAYQKVFFSEFVYNHLRPVFPDESTSVAPSLEWMNDDDNVLCVAGIGNPKPFVKFVKHFRPRVLVNLFPDHHNFTRKDMKLLENRFKSMSGRTNIIVTTEKDAVRMANCPYFPHALKASTFYLPVQVDIQRNEAAAFEDTLRRLLKSKIF